MRWKTMCLLGGGLLLLRRFDASTRRRISFAGSSVLISGGSRGLGLELARQFAREGARLALIARDASELERAVCELRATGATAMGVPCDVTQREQVQAAVREVAGQFGRIDVLVNNAGVIQVGPLDQMTAGDFESAMDVHFRGPLWFMLEVIPHLRRQGGGRIVNIVSLGGKIAVPHLLPYSASKFALAGLSQGMRSELRRQHILVTTVFPGLMRTGSIYSAWFKGRHEAEFSWFGTAGSLPGLSMNAARAAGQVVEACRRGAPHLVLGLPAKMASLAGDLAPGITAEALAWMERLLPASPSTAGTRGRRGYEARPRKLPALFTRLSDVAARRNNQIPTKEAS